MTILQNSNVQISTSTSPISLVVLSNAVRTPRIKYSNITKLSHAYDLNRVWYRPGKKRSNGIICIE